jgi:hypothetical protein
MGTGALSPGVKHGRGVTLTTHPHLVPRSRMSNYFTRQYIQEDSSELHKYYCLLTILS